ncbi:MAG: SDR family oxidoreductase, partial [Myxococcota bacterium]
MLSSNMVVERSATQEEDMEFKDKGVIVTGASRGLGLGLVIGLLRRGARVVGVARDSKALDTAFASLRADQATVWALPADVRNPDAATRVVGYANAVLGRIDALFNNASTLGPVPMEELNDASDADWLDVLQANLLGPVRLTRAALPSLTRHGEGLVVNVSSDAARNAYPTWGLYSASKAALDHTTAVWRAEQEQA